MGESDKLAGKAFRRCHRFDWCGTVVCPLDPGMGERVRVRGVDKPCSLSKAKRMALGVHLPWKGMTKREWTHYCREHPDEAVPYPEVKTIPE